MTQMSKDNTYEVGRASGDSTLAFAWAFTRELGFAATFQGVQPRLLAPDIVARHRHHALPHLDG